MSNPEFIVLTGPMFSSKTSTLLMMLERFKYQKKNVSVFKPQIDSRYSTDHVVSHLGWKVEATVVKSGIEVLEYLKSQTPSPSIVAVDEMFMIDGVGDVLIWLYRNLGMTILTSTLDISANGKSFSEVAKVLPWATKVVKCTAVCTVCGEEAHYTYKKIVDDEEIQVGGSEIYEPRCFQHHIGINLKNDL